MSKEHNSDELVHLPVLLDAVVNQLNPKKGENYLDLTAGYGGHASRILKMTGNYTESVLVDRDEWAIKSLKSLSAKGARLIKADFVTAAKQLAEEGKTFDMILADLGVSSPQLDFYERGFSFTNSGPLDMRMDQSQAKSAKTLINQASEKELVRIISQYGEEPIGRAKQIAEAIIANRPLSETGELAEVVKNLQRGGWTKTHPATRTFQAIRIAVNDELRLVKDLLPLLPRLLKPGGRVAVISFHSLEDRLVKRYFKEQSNSGYEAELSILTKKPILGANEDVHNPRSRSSKMRVAVKK